ncbi:ATP-dependent helicase [Candidatus Neomarinimicrobiota bacterium]
MIDIGEPLESYKEYPGPTILLAGPGTGKTFQITHRVKYLIEELGVSPNEIAIVTFTTEAARSMREKLAEKDLDLDPEKIPEIISTMHSMGNSIIGSAPDLVGLPEEYKLLSDGILRRLLLQDAAFLESGDRSIYEDTEQCRGHGDCNRDAEDTKCQICIKYVELLRKSRSIDYDDQIYLACELLRNNANITEGWRNKCKHLLIDEFQDINQAQCELIQLLSFNQTEGLFAVGDDDQSIYSFRGGTPKFVREFDSIFEGESKKIGRLSISWRCSEHILLGAKSMLEKHYDDSEPKPAPVFSDKITHNNKIEFIDLPSEKWEAIYMASHIGKHIKENRIAVLIPNGKYFPLIRDALRGASIPYHYKIGFDNEGISRISLLSDCLENLGNNPMLRYYLDLVIRNHDELTMTYESSSNNLTEKRQAASNEVTQLWEDVARETSFEEALRSRAEKEPDSFIARLLDQSIDQMAPIIISDGRKRSSLPKFLSNAAHFVAPGKNPERLIEEIRDLRNELLGARRGSSFLPVNIYNMHSSKGLECDIVFVIGLSDGLFPRDDVDIAEQARLFYVAMTRAKKRLIILNARTRSGSITLGRRSYQLKPSPFVERIDNNHIDKQYFKTKK